MSELQWASAPFYAVIIENEPMNYLRKNLPAYEQTQEGLLTLIELKNWQ